MPGWSLQHVQPAAPVLWRSGASCVTQLLHVCCAGLTPKDKLNERCGWVGNFWIPQNPPSTQHEFLLHCHAVCRQTFMTVSFRLFYPGPPSTLYFCLGGVCSMSNLLHLCFGFLGPAALRSCCMSVASSCARLTPPLTSSRSFAKFNISCTLSWKCPDSSQTTPWPSSVRKSSRKPWPIETSEGSNLRFPTLHPKLSHFPPKQKTK